MQRNALGLLFAGLAAALAAVAAYAFAGGEDARRIFWSPVLRKSSQSCCVSSARAVTPERIRRFPADSSPAQPRRRRKALAESVASHPATASAAAPTTIRRASSPPANA